MDLITAFDIRAGDMVAIVGGGGKSSLMFALERAWQGNILLTTTTRIFQAQIKRARTHLALEDVDQLGDKLAEYGSCLIIGKTAGEKAHGVGVEMPALWLARPDVDLVVIEADGSRMRPIKAPAKHEPVIPPATTLCVVVMGMDALERPILEVAHRPELVCEITGLVSNELLTPAAVATLLTSKRGGLKGVSEGVRVAVCINKVETAERQQTAKLIAKRLLASDKVDHVILTALRSSRELYPPQNSKMLPKQPD